MRVDDLRQELESLAESAPVPPHDPGAAVRRGRARRARAWLLRAAAATTVGVVVVAGLVQIERDPHREVVRAGPGPSSSSPSLLGGRALPPSGLIVLDSPRNGGSQQPASWSIALLDDEGHVLAQLPRATIDNDVFNQHWNLRVVATNSEVSIEHPPLDGTPACRPAARSRSARGRSRCAASVLRAISSSAPASWSGLVTAGRR